MTRTNARATWVGGTARGEQVLVLDGEAAAA